jgi:predicted Fe-Mo cluster-binding NifX family protein
MKTAIVASEGSFESGIDPHFARCAFFVIHDRETASVEFLPNVFKNMKGEIGVKVVEMLVLKGVSKVVMRDFGQKVKSKLDSTKIQIVVVKNDSLTVKDILNYLNKK